MSTVTVPAHAVSEAPEGQPEVPTATTVGSASAPSSPPVPTSQIAFTGAGVKNRPVTTAAVVGLVAFLVVA